MPGESDGYLAQYENVVVFRVAKKPEKKSFSVLVHKLCMSKTFVIFN
jgi:hypothetical protein